MAAWILIIALTIPLRLDLYMPVPEENPLTDAKINWDSGCSTAAASPPIAPLRAARVTTPTGRSPMAAPVAIGIGRRAGHHAPRLINRGYGRAFFWDGRAATLEEQVLQPIQDPNEMDMTLAEASARVGMPTKRCPARSASFVRSILSGDSAFDRFINGDRSALSRAAGRLAAVPRQRQLHRVPRRPDLHRRAVSQHRRRVARRPRCRRRAICRQRAGEDRGAFKTPTLREIPRTAPYMHDGSLGSLRMSSTTTTRGGNPNPGLDVEPRPLNLTLSEKAIARGVSARAQRDHPRA